MATLTDEEKIRVLKLKDIFNSYKQQKLLSSSNLNSYGQLIYPH